MDNVRYAGPDSSAPSPLCSTSQSRRLCPRTPAHFAWSDTPPPKRMPLDGAYCTQALLAFTYGVRPIEPPDKTMWPWWPICTPDSDFLQSLSALDPLVSRRRACRPPRHSFPSILCVLPVSSLSGEQVGVGRRKDCMQTNVTSADSILPPPAATCPAILHPAFGH